MGSLLFRRRSWGRDWTATTGDGLLAAPRVAQHGHQREAGSADLVAIDLRVGAGPCAGPAGDETATGSPDLPPEIPNRRETDSLAQFREADPDGRG